MSSNREAKPEGELMKPMIAQAHQMPNIDLVSCGSHEADELMDEHLHLQKQKARQQVPNLFSTIIFSLLDCKQA